MSQKDHYQFYSMMWYPAPFQKEFFGYFADGDFLGGWEPLEFSRAKKWDRMDLFHGSIEKRTLLRSKIPFVEQVYITWTHSFNHPSKNDKIWLLVISSMKRHRLCRFFVQFLLFFINLYQRWKVLPQFFLQSTLSQDSLSVQHLLLPEFDVMLVYQLAHLGLRYQRFPQMSRSMFDENHRLFEYLPHFPSQPVVWLGITPRMWKSGYCAWWERVLWWVWGDVCNVLTRIWSLWVLMIRRTFFTKLPVSLQESQVRSDIRDRNELSLKWKLSRKTEKSNR